MEGHKRPCDQLQIKFSRSPFELFISVSYHTCPSQGFDGTQVSVSHAAVLLPANKRTNTLCGV